MKNSDRYSFDVTLDLTPADVGNMLTSANSGSTQRQSRIANELIEKDPAISQAWNVRVAAIASCPWEIEGENSEFVKKILDNINPSYDTGLVSFIKLLNNLQSAVLHGFATVETYWTNGGASIDGFKIYDQSLFSFVESPLPFYQDYMDKKAKKLITFPRWIYHIPITACGSEPLRTGLVRPLAYLYSFRRHVMIQYLSGIEKYGTPFPMVKVDDSFYEDNTKRQQIEDMLANWTYNGWAISPSDGVEITFPTSTSQFSVDTFTGYMEFSEKQIFRLILGQDSTSSADNSNRSTAQVHNLVRQDLLASDAVAVEETINTQIISPLIEANFGSGAVKPKFKFKFKGVQDMIDYANFIKTLGDAGYEVNTKDLSAKMGIEISKKGEPI